jgi:hypothetical protein
MGLSEELDRYEHMVRRDQGDPLRLATALVCKGMALAELGRASEAIDAFDEVVARFGDAPERVLRRQTAEALFYKAEALAGMGQRAAAIEACLAVRAIVGPLGPWAADRGADEARLYETAGDLHARELIANAEQPAPERQWPPPRRDAQEPVIEQLRRAFAETPYPGDDAIVSHHCGECDALADCLAGRDWRELGPELLRRDASEIYLLTPAAFRYFVPAYALAAIAEPCSGCMVPDVLVGCFAPGIVVAKERIAERIGALSAEELEAMLAVIRFLRFQSPGMEVETRVALARWDI